MVYTLRCFPSKCSLFHNSNVFGSSIIHILYTGCAKIKKIQAGKVNSIEEKILLEKLTFLVCLEIPCHLQTLHVNYKVHNSPTLIGILNQPIPAHALTWLRPIYHCSIHNDIRYSDTQEPFAMTRFTITTYRL